MKKLISLLLVLSLCLMGVAFAKSTSVAIDAPADDAVVFSITDGKTTAEYTWLDLTQEGRFTLTTKTYPAKVNGENTTQDWTGVLLSALLSDAKTQGVLMEDDYNLSAVASDGFESYFTVADVMDETMVYIVAGDPVHTTDGDVDYGDTFVRIMRDMPMANQASMRCILSLTVLDAQSAPLFPAEETAAQ